MGSFARTQNLPLQMTSSFQALIKQETHQMQWDQESLLSMWTKYQDAKGTLYVGFVTSNPDNRFFSKVLKTGDVFVFPVGLIHFQLNIGKTNAIAFAGLSSQNPGVITIANAVFGSNPPINPDVLAKAFKLEKKVVEFLQTRF
ncbi:hypothetical protein REPUB_Repub16aG0103300 [Reevesia pubescens]